jgi:hypothetical protein
MATSGFNLLLQPSFLRPVGDHSWADGDKFAAIAKDCQLQNCDDRKINLTRAESERIRKAPEG